MFLCIQALVIRFSLSDTSRACALKLLAVVLLFDGGTKSETKAKSSWLSSRLLFSKPVSYTAMASSNLLRSENNSPKAL